MHGCWCRSVSRRFVLELTAARATVREVRLHNGNTIRTYMFTFPQSPTTRLRSVPILYAVCYLTYSLYLHCSTLIYYRYYLISYYEIEYTNILQVLTCPLRVTTYNPARAVREARELQLQHNT